MSNNKNNNLLENTDESINIFANNNNNTIIVDTLEEIPEYERIYDDEEIYRRDLENTFLSMFPISKQGTPYVKAQVKKNVDSILNVRKIGNDNVEANGNIYAFHTFNNIFKYKWIIPIVKDKFEIFSEIIDENYSENNILNVENNRNKEGIKVTDQRVLLKKLSEIEYKYQKQKLSLNQYLTEKYKLLNPYKFIDSSKGYSIISKNDDELLRLYDIDSHNWSTRKSHKRINTQIATLDKDTDTLIIQNKELVPAEKINIVGFLILNIFQDDFINIIQDDTGFGRFNRNADISKIETGDKTTITLDNIKNKFKINDLIYIQNSTPNIDGKHIIENINNNKITINLDTNNLESSDLEGGYVFSIHKLDFDRINISKNNNKININFNDNNKNKLFLFDKFKVNKDDLKEILYKIIPSTEQLLGRLYEIIKDESLIKDIYKKLFHKLIDPYNLNISDNKFILDILNKNKIKKEEFKYSKPQKIKDDILKNSIYSYDNLTNKEIKQYYGDYPLFKTIYDNYTTRMLWVNEQPDEGQLFYRIIKKDNTSLNNKDIENELKSLKKPSSKELDVKIRIVGVTDDEKELNDFYTGFPDDKALLNGVLYKYNKKWIIDDKKYNKGDKALHSEYLYANEYTFNGSKWNFTKTLKPFYKRLNDFCYENGKMYYENKCVDQSFIDYIIEKQTYETILEDINNKSKTENVDFLKNLFPVFTFDEKKKDEVEIKEDKYTSLTIERLKEQISKIPNDELRNDLLFKLIREDGITFNKTIFSKKFGGRIECGHWKYLMNIYNSTDNKERERLTDEMVTIYGDGGETKKDQITCIKCGQYLRGVDMDDVYGFTLSGSAIRVTSLLEKDYIQAEKERSKILEENELVLTINPDSNTFKTDLMTFKIEKDNYKGINKIAELLNAFNMKTGFAIKKIDYYNIILKAHNSVSQTYSYATYRAQFIKMNKKGPEYIKKLDQKNMIKKMYKAYTKKRLYSIIGAILLVFLQTATPAYVKKQGNTKCVFFGLNDEKGLDFMQCLIEEMNKGLKNVRKELDNQFTFFKSINKDLYEKKQKFLETKKEIKETFKNENKVVKDFNKIITKVDSSSMKNVPLFDANYTYTALKIIDNIFDVISKVPLLDNLEQISNSCCSENVADNKKYNYFIEENNKDFKNIMEKSYKWEEYYIGIVRYGSVSRLVTLSHDRFIQLIMTTSHFVLNNPDSKVEYVIDFIKEIIDDKEYKKFSKITEKDIERVSSNLFKNLIKKTGSKKEEVNREKNKLLNTLNEDYLQTINFINSYVRKNLWIIKNKFTKKVKKITFAETSDMSKEMQKFIGETKIPIQKFISNSNSFKKINLEYHIDYLNNLLKNINELKEKNFDKIHRIVTFIILTELNKMSYDGDRFVNDFILTIIKIFNDNVSEFKLIEKEFDTFLKVNEISRKKQLLGTLKAGDLIDEFDVTPNILDMEADEISEKDLTEKYKEEYLEEHGELPNEDQIEAYMEEYFHQLQIDKDINEENFLTLQPHETNENMSMGDDYGEMPQGVESAGDGFSYVTENYEMST